MLQTLTTAADLILAAPPTPDPAAPTNDGSFLNTAGVVTFLLSWVAPIMCAVLGAIFLGRAKNGEVSKVLTSSGIALVGFAFIGGAIALPLIGDDIVNLFISAK